MPELPEVEALAYHLREHAVGRTVTRVDVASFGVLKTVTPQWTELHGRTVTGAGRHGKHLDLDCDGLHLVVHLARAGWLRWSDSLSPVPPKPGRGPLALRVHLGGPGFDLTEAGTKKGLAVWIVRDPQEVPSIARLGPDALELTREKLGELLAGRTERLKNALTDQSLIAGIGNAYSDEILHAAKLSPYATPGKLTEDTLDRLYEAMQQVLTDAVTRSVGQDAARLKGEKRSGLRVHARAGLPCPVCGDTVREISFADKAFQYCPTCQTGGKPLADRRMSRLLK
ncbi:formamidopyrimidine-DNA glycosylase [Amycolatopsis bartoniae]|uniref:Formamidopyrimidine-DNA glycosylase n=1 Tax=Amycolatopsis bartoniae TaxID=941986 RepID=A0A8H9IVH2_9PSEU|nr:DNA-formamidopyrimidine glycosylase family protein [Amycolatopsis bartoniae]MBB2933329.1 formamidopyrimidine-DNA glycosylase [Amycolatopsis bartoniae]TVT08065.1 Fpg/Nei family DNA glycosylase [Amycolatopsis bartoniae]GHF58742.1 formamidopyrimidine-DNA glycosylase [Amycolatopsis bartoniae]